MEGTPTPSSNLTSQRRSALSARRALRPAPTPSANPQPARTTTVRPFTLKKVSLPVRAAAAAAEDDDEEDDVPPNFDLGGSSPSPSRAASTPKRVRRSPSPSLLSSGEEQYRFRLSMMNRPSPKPSVALAEDGGSRRDTLSTLGSGGGGGGGGGERLDFEGGDGFEGGDDFGAEDEVGGEGEPYEREMDVSPGKAKKGGRKGGAPLPAKRRRVGGEGVLGVLGGGKKRKEKERENEKEAPSKFNEGGGSDASYDPDDEVAELDGSESASSDSCSDVSFAPSVSKMVSVKEGGTGGKGGKRRDRLSSVSASASKANGKNTPPSKGDAKKPSGRRHKEKVTCWPAELMPLFVNVCSRAGSANKTDLRDLLFSYVIRASQALEVKEAAERGLSADSGEWMSSERGMQFDNANNNVWGLTNPMAGGAKKGSVNSFMDELLVQVPCRPRLGSRGYHTQKLFVMKDKEKYESMMATDEDYAAGTAKGMFGMEGVTLGDGYGGLAGTGLPIVTELELAYDVAEEALGKVYKEADGSAKDVKRMCKGMKKDLKRWVADARPHIISNVIAHCGIRECYGELRALREELLKSQEVRSSEQRSDELKRRFYRSSSLCADNFVCNVAAANSVVISFDT